MSDVSEEALRRHDRACEERKAGYIDPDSGLFVMTSYHLQRRGRCCGSGCRHCPWSAEEQARAGRPAGMPAFPYRGEM